MTTSTSTTVIGNSSLPTFFNESSSDVSASGSMAAFILASINSYVSIEDWQTKGEMGFSNFFTKMSQQWGDFFLKIMDAPSGTPVNNPVSGGMSDEAFMQYIIGNSAWDSSDKNTYLQVASSNLNIHNTEYNQITTNYTGDENGASQGAANANSSLGNILSGMGAITTLMQSVARA